MGWPIQPDGLRDLLRRVHRDYTGPAGVALYVTENGAAFDDRPEMDGVVHDDDRIEFLYDHLDAILDAIEDGVDGPRLLLLVTAGQLRVGLGVRQAVRTDPGGLRQPAPNRQGLGLGVRPGDRHPRARCRGAADSERGMARQHPPRHRLSRAVRCE